MMKHKRFVVFFVVAIALMIVLIAALSLVHAGPTQAYAAEIDAQEPETPTDEETDEDAVTGIVDGFIEALKAKYGADYEIYLNAILEQWGSIEAYLLSMTYNLPEEFQTGWQAFIGWLGEYATVWAPCLAVALIIITLIIGKKALNKILNRIVEARIKPIQNELNKQSEAQAAQLKATRALLGTNEKFAEERKAAEEAEKNLLE